MGVQINGNQAVINGKVYNLPPHRSTSINNVNGNVSIVLDGKPWTPDGDAFPNAGHVTIEVIVTGDPVSVHANAPVTVNGNVTGGVKAEGPVRVSGSVAGDVYAEGPINCGNVGGNAKAEGPMNCGNVQGNAHADGPMVRR
jgi:hypothetical protein